MGIRFFPKINSILNEVEFVEENQSLTQKKIILEQNYVFHEIDFKNKKLNFFFLKSDSQLTKRELSYINSVQDSLAKLKSFFIVLVYDSSPMQKDNHGYYQIEAGQLPFKEEKIIYPYYMKIENGEIIKNKTTLFKNINDENF